MGGAEDGFCCDKTSALQQETRRSYEAHRRSLQKEMAQVIDLSHKSIMNEATSALRRLESRGYPGGTQVYIVTSYVIAKSPFLRRILGRKGLTEERMAWWVPFAGHDERHVMLLSDGIIYEDWRIEDDTMDGITIIAGLKPLNTSAPERGTGLFVSPRRPRIQRHVSQIVHKLQQLGT